MFSSSHLNSDKWISLSMFQVHRVKLRCCLGLVTHELGYLHIVVGSQVLV